MTIYGVIMGQGVSVDNLTNHTLVTGYGDANDRIQSCSAVILVKTTNRKAGLFHFPAGNINGDQRSKNVLMEMIMIIEPTEIVVAYGTAAFIRVANYGNGEMDAFDAMEETSKLTSFLRKEASEAIIRTMPANTGIINVHYHNGQPTVGAGPIEGITDLRGQQNDPGCFIYRR